MNKNIVVYMLLGLLLGAMGVHRFYAGKWVTGIIYCVTFGLFTVGLLYDGLVLVFGTPRDSAGHAIGTQEVSQ